MMWNNRLGRDFFIQDALVVAPSLIGKYLIRVLDNNYMFKSIITEVEAYRGIEDMACHASKGRTPRTEIMYHAGGYIYVYLVYGMYWMLNFVTGLEGKPQAVLIRGLEHINGPGRITKNLKIDRSFYGEDLIHSKLIWVEDNAERFSYTENVRVGVDYAGEYWSKKSWRFIIDREA